jgi:hypothetical protein
MRTRMTWKTSWEEKEGEEDEDEDGENMKPTPLGGLKWLLFIIMNQIVVGEIFT